MREQHCGRPSDVYNTDRPTKLTALETISRWLILKSEKNRYLSHPLWHLGVTYALHLWLIGKPVIDFIFVVIELFSLSPTVETLWAEIGRSRGFSKGWVTLNADFRGKGCRRPTTVGIRVGEWLPFRVVSKYPQCIVWFCHKARVWEMDGQMDRPTELRLPRPRSVSYTHLTLPTNREV